MLVRRALIPTGALLVALASGPLAAAAVAEPCEKDPKAVAAQDCEDKDNNAGGNGNGRPTASPSAKAANENKPTARPSANPSSKPTARPGSKASDRPSGKPTSAQDRPQDADRGNRDGAKGDPRGNNGTIKIDGEPFDTSHGNEPHVGCTFRLIHWGFDKGQTADITFTGHAPTGGGTLLTLRGVRISDDAAGGGQDLDAVLTFTAQQLGLFSIPPAKQGWHVKVAVDALEAPGGAKQKVFWIQCDVPAPVTTADARDAAPAAVRRQEQFTGGGAGVVTLDPPAAVTVAGPTRTQAQPKVRANGGGFATTLPFTGAPLVALLALGLGALGAGGMALRAARNRS